ncbi:hypothetical protein FALBO_15681 [Fusarium albosuccineum]|uniref:Clr5 domain-containing protein n=1 Tax=Fusarium albosuccineum TaxID=1237068 RepID=A0A8H4NXU9_9HYPO|nr:hypothetical protein FALBO_15681 [Fusarium albosuccineum]
MDPIPVGLLPQSDDDKFLSCSYEERWNHLKPVIVELYTSRHGSNGRSTTLDQVVEFMRNHYSFHAACTEYRRRFRAWGVTKRMVKEDKDAIVSALVRNKRPGASISHVTIQKDGQTQPLDPKKLKRHLIGRKAPFLETIAPGLLSSWNLPYAAFISSLPKNPGEPSPFGTLHLTPDYLHIQSPEALTPGRTAAGPSPRMQLVYEKQKENHTSLFLQGRLKQLMVEMCKEDRRTMVNYFHDFYIHGFVLAKNWGQEPLKPSPAQASGFTPPTWNAASPWTPSAFLNLPSGHSSPEAWSTTDISLPPTQLCQWSIHVKPSYERVETMDVTDPANLEPPPTSFVESLQQSMASNDFTSTPKGDLPLAQDIIMQPFEGNRNPLQLDAWKLAIMAGNSDLLWQLREENGEAPPEGIEAINPFHVAAAFLDGGHKCCEIFTTLSAILDSSFAFYHNTDDLGHTILDALVVSVLRSHTSLHPDAVSYGFQFPNRFPGEEKDICGRWDANTSHVRELFKQGYARIPTKWKHSFCHTSVQAVCHSIVAIFASPASPNINTPSGLFLRRCTECGLELRLGSLHALVVTTFYLAQLGMPGETLFGALALLVCLLSLGADPSLKANVSVDEILRSSEPGTCLHRQLSPLELMQAVPMNVIQTWSEDCRTGWGCFIETLVCAATGEHQEPRDRSSMCQQDGERLGSPMEDLSQVSDDGLVDEVCEFEEDIHEFWLGLPCKGPQIGLLWATIQAELLSYRRLGEGEPWISAKFSMIALTRWLKGDSAEFQTPLVENQMLTKFTRCGWFNKTSDFLHPIAQEVCAEYFMNMDIYSRASYIESPYVLEYLNEVQRLEDNTAGETGEG